MKILIGYDKHPDLGGVQQAFVLRDHPTLPDLKECLISYQSPMPLEELAGLSITNTERSKSGGLTLTVERKDWQPIETAPKDGKSEQFLVTNNLEARDANGNMSNLWLVRMVHPPREGKDIGWSAFDSSDRSIGFLTHWRAL